MWACSSAGRALAWHVRGRRFDPDQVHQSLFLYDLNHNIFQSHFVTTVLVAEGRLTILDLRSFKASHALGLVFSIFDGLHEGASLRLIVSHDPQQIKKTFQEVGIEVGHWKIHQATDGIWELEIAKIS